MTETSAIRVGLVGLSTDGGWASLAHFPYLQQSSFYRITALCNSSLARAEAARAHFDLSPSVVKVYGDAVALANDPDIDLVVCCVRVDKHYKVCRAAIEARKDCLTEWPLGKCLEETEELADLALKYGVRTVICLQGRRNVALQKMRQLLRDGIIGRVLSTSVISATGCLGLQEPARLKYVNEQDTGGDMVSLFFGHCKRTLAKSLPMNQSGLVWRLM